MKINLTLPVLLTLVSFNAISQDCATSSEIERLYFENKENENLHYCKELKVGENRHLNGDSDRSGVILSVNLKQQTATWNYFMKQYPVIETLLCENFFSEAEKLKLTSGDPRILDGKARYSAMISNKCKK